ncbi:MAG: hypothetical protein QOI29_2940, partial [Mycobacterium sp.]|nr:hypothetical protein [Mycobacterium sp.]
MVPALLGSRQDDREGKRCRLVRMSVQDTLSEHAPHFRGLAHDAVGIEQVRSIA